MSMSFIDQKKLLYENMNHFNQLREFEKEFSKLSNKYKSLPEDLKKFERFIFENPTGLGKNFVIMHDSEKAKIVKARMVCKYLKNRSMRIIYAYHQQLITFVYLEVYFKGDKENEDRERIEEYLKSIRKY